MSTRRPRGKFVLLALAGAAVFGLASAQAAVARHGRAAQKPIAGDTPAAVAQGKAHLRGHHDPNAVLRVNVGLAVRNSDGLDALIRAASTPGSPQYGHYLTNAQYMAQYAPTDADVQAVSSWLRSQGLTVLDAASDNLIVHAQGTVKVLERAFGVTINDYDENGRAFHSNDRDPAVPAGLAVSWISGLSSYNVYKVYHSAVTCEVNPPNKCGYDGGDFRKAYDIVGDGSGQTLGLTLWGQHLPQSDYNGYATATGNPKIVVGGAGDNGLDFVNVDGASGITNTDNEVALDTEIAHGVAPGIHMTYWLGVDNSDGTLEDVLNAAKASGLKVISNSWGCDGCGTDSTMDSILQAGAATGQTFYFSSGDSGASVGRSRPADSPYVVAVGGTNLNIDGSGNWSSETAWSGSGGGCENGYSRPSWQTGIGTAYVWPSTACTGRAEPDVAANAGFGTYLFFDGSETCCTGGTSLAAPIWAAASIIWNKHNASSGRPGIGFAAPILYALANDSTTYARDFHDITSGSNGFSAGTGWDEVTGWGSPIFNELSNNVPAVKYTGPTQASKGDSITLSGSLLDNGGPLATAGISTLKLSFAAASSSCDGNVDGSGNASCGVTITADPGKYKAIAAFAGDAAYTGGSQTVDFTVLHIPTMLTYTGATSGDYNDAVTLSAKLIDNSGPTSFSHLQPIPNETLTFTLGAESCTGVTDSGGVASCTLTPHSPADVPGPYTASVSFAGDGAVYNSSSASAAFTLNKEESKIAYTGPLTSHYHDTVTASARLYDPDGSAGIAGKTVTFTLGVGDTCNATTDGSGNASCTITPTQTGTQNMVASFPGDPYYLASPSDTESFSITPEETTMRYTGPTVILAGSGGATLTARLVEDGANDTDGDGGLPAPVPAETVTLSLGSQACTGPTDLLGNVSCTIPSVTVPLGPETVGAAFVGDAYYQAASASTTATVFAFPSSGVFALGDLTVGAAPPSVTWWSNDWYLANNLSGGLAPPAFKGFVASVTLPTATPANVCSSTWTTTGGNSALPPATVPSYMGVIVASNITKTGSTIKNNYAQIVVVKTDPGYAPGPNNAGTGTIVADFCP